MNRLLAAVLLVAGIVGYVAWQRPAAPVPPPASPKDVVLQYADGRKLWSSTDGAPRPDVAERVLAELKELSLPYDSLRVTGGVVRTTIDAKQQTVAATVLGRLFAPRRTPDPSATRSYLQPLLDASMTAVDPGSGGVRVYRPGFGVDRDLASGAAQDPPPALAEPFASTGVRDVVKERVTPLDVTAAYATLAAGGVQRKPHLVSTVTAADGSLLYQASDTAQPVFAKDRAERITASLKEKPACNGVACVPEASPWMVGYTPQLVVTVYVEKVDAVVDADLPGVIWREFMTELAR